MNDAKALTEIQRLASLDRIALTRHAMQRMQQRRARLDDVRRALATATTVIAQDRGWRVEGGRDMDGDDLVVVVDIEADVIVIHRVLGGPMKCPSCQKNALLAWEGPITRMGVEIVAHGQRCSACGEELYDAKEIDRQDALITDALVARGIRTGEEFVFVRKSAGLAAADVARLFGVRPETVWRWEHDESEIPRTAAFALGELYKHPRLTRERFEALAAS